MHPPSPILCYPLLSCLVPLTQHSIWNASASLHPSFSLSTCLCVTFSLYPVFFVPACPSRTSSPHRDELFAYVSADEVPLHRSSSLVFVILSQDGEGIRLILFMATDCSLGQGTISPCAFVRHLANLALTKVCSGSCDSLIFVLPAEDPWSKPLGAGRQVVPLPAVFCSILSAGRGTI